MLSRKLWRTLEYEINFWRFNMGYGKLILPPADTHYKQPSELISLLVIPWICICAFIPYFIIPLTTTYLCARMAWRTTLALARLHELGRYDVVSITPAGFWNIALPIGRNYTKHTLNTAGGLYVLGMLFSAFAFVVVGINGRTGTALISAIVIEATLCAAVYFDFRQALSLGFLISVAGSHLRERSTATVAAIAAFVGIQLIGYLVWFVIFYITTTALYFAWIRDGLYLSISVTSATVTLLLMREILIYGLWRWLTNRVNDDMPVLAA